MQINEAHAPEAWRGMSPPGMSEPTVRPEFQQHQPPALPPPGKQAQVNVSEAERALSAAAGAIIALLGLQRGSLSGLLMAGVGGALIYRGVTGHCSAYQALGVNTALDTTEESREMRREQD